MDAAEAARPRRLVIALVALAVFAALIALGTWQLERRAWKQALIARVEQRAHAEPLAAPARDTWPEISVARDEYRRIRIAGRFASDRDTLVQATTVLGAGHWVLTPLQARDGSVVLVNRGFVPLGAKPRASMLAGDSRDDEHTVTGLLRITEPRGGFLRRNAPAQDRWHSRDVQAIAAARGLKDVAPYFIDADAAPQPAPGDTTLPVGGLTVLAFHDNHLVYALTWFALAAMVAIGTRRALRT